MKTRNTIRFYACFVAVSLACYALFLCWSRWDGERLSLFRAFLLWASPFVVYTLFLPFALFAPRESDNAWPDTGGIDRLAKWKKTFKAWPAPPRSKREPKRLPLPPRTINGTKGDLERLVKAKARLEANEAR